MDIERVVLEDDLETAKRDVRDYRSRVAVARVGIQAMLESMGKHALMRAEPFRQDLKRLADILDGELADVNAFRRQTG